MRKMIYVNDSKIRENFESIQEEITDNIFHNFKGRLFEITVDSSVSGETYKHNLGFIPKDVIELYVSDGATITWNYDDFDSDNIDFDTSAGCTFRALIGKFITRI